MNTKRRITVVLGDNQHLVGELIFEESQGRQHSAFRYLDQWLQSPLRFAITPSMPLRAGWESFSGKDEYSLPGPIADTAPDSWGRNVIQASLGRAASEIEILLSANDETRSGALRYIDEEGRLMSTEVPPVPRLPTLRDLREMNRRFEAGDGDLTRLARELRGAGDSLGGARPKSAIYDGNVLSIAKYTSERDTMPVERMEVATLNLARAVGLRASEARLELQDTSHPVAIIRRFDRDENGRQHFVTGRSFLNIRDSDTPAYYTDLVEVMRGNCGNGEQTLTEIRELFRRVMFMLLVSNTDDHMKNHGFLYAGEDRWKLSPAYDINPQPHRHRQLKTGISLLSGFESTVQALVESAPLFEIEQSDAASMAFDMATIVRDKWRGMCGAVGMSQREIDQYSPAFNHSEMKSALSMGRTKSTFIKTEL